MNLNRLSRYLSNRSELFLNNFIKNNQKLKLSFYCNGFLYFWQYVKLNKYFKNSMQFYKLDMLSNSIYGKIVMYLIVGDIICRIFIILLKIILLCKI